MNAVNASETKINHGSYEVMSVLDARSLGYYKIDHKAPQQNLNNYQFESLPKLCINLMITVMR